MRRGDVLTVILPGDYGKPRPAIVVQEDDLVDIESVLVCPLTSHRGMHADFRPGIEPNDQNGLTDLSFAMTDKVTAIPRRRCGPLMGRIDIQMSNAIDESLLFVLGLAR